MQGYGCYCPAPICLLYVNGAKKLVPIAIQLKKTPGPDNPIFLPSDNWFDWVLAKIYYRSADAQVCIPSSVFHIIKIWLTVLLEYIVYFL